MGGLISTSYNAASAIGNYKSANQQAQGAQQIASALANPYIAATNPLQAAMDEQRQAIKGQQELYGEQAGIALQESGVEAQQKARQVNTFQQHQASGYNNSGVMLQGSPMLVMEYTRQQGQQEVDAITRMGQAQADLLNRQSYVVGANMEAQLLGDQSQFITNQAQQQIQANMLSNTALQGGYATRLQGLAGLNSAIGGALPSLFGNSSTQFGGLLGTPIQNWWNSLGKPPNQPMLPGYDPYGMGNNPGVPYAPGYQLPPLQDPNNPISGSGASTGNPFDPRSFVFGN